METEWIYGTSETSEIEEANVVLKDYCRSDIICRKNFISKCTKKIFPFPFMSQFCILPAWQIPFQISTNSKQPLARDYNLFLLLY
jgi:hypothetical protein